MTRILNKRYYNIYTLGGGIIKRKIYLILVIVVTFTTTRAIMYLHPNSDNELSRERYLQLSSLLTTIKSEAIRDDEVFHEMDDQTLNKFLKFYSNKGPDKLEIFEKEEIRYILESMGKYNVDKLKKLLEISLEKKEERIYKLLSENLFDEQLMILNEMVN